MFIESYIGKFIDIVSNQWNIKKQHLQTQFRNEKLTNIKKSMKKRNKKK